MHVGEPVALVLAATLAQAQDAADKVIVDYAPLAAVTDVREAVKPEAPQLWPEAPGNIAFDWTAPADPDGKNQAALERAFAQAAHVVKVELINQRLVAAALEPRSATASYDAAAKRFTLRCPTQGVAEVRGQVAASLSVKPERTARDLRGCRRRLRHEGLPAIRNMSRCCTPRARSAAGALGVDAARKPS